MKLLDRLHRPKGYDQLVSPRIEAQTVATMNRQMAEIVNALADQPHLKLARLHPKPNHIAAILDAQRAVTEGTSRLRERNFNLQGEPFILMEKALRFSVAPDTLALILYDAKVLSASVSSIDLSTIGERFTQISFYLFPHPVRQPSDIMPHVNVGKGVTYEVNPTKGEIMHILDPGPNEICFPYTFVGEYSGSDYHYWLYGNLNDAVPPRGNQRQPKTEARSVVDMSFLRRALPRQMGFS